jgi:hypothetical protein
MKNCRAGVTSLLSITFRGGFFRDRSKGAFMLDAFDQRLLGSRLLVLGTDGAGLVGLVSSVSPELLTLEGESLREDAFFPEDVRRLWILRPSEELTALTAVGRWVGVLLADGSRLVGRVLEHLGLGSFLVTTAVGSCEVAWLDVQQLTAELQP